MTGMGIPDVRAGQGWAQLAENYKIKLLEITGAAVQRNQRE